MRHGKAGRHTALCLRERQATLSCPEPFDIHRVRRRPSLGSETAKRSRQVNGILAIMQQSDADNSRLGVDAGFSPFPVKSQPSRLSRRRETRSESNSGPVFHDGVMQTGTPLTRPNSAPFAARFTYNDNFWMYLRKRDNAFSCYYTWTY